MFPFKGIAGAESGLSPKCMEKRHDMLVFLFPDELQGCSSGALGTEKAVSTVYSVGKVRKKRRKVSSYRLARLRHCRARATVIPALRSRRSHSLASNRELPGAVSISPAVKRQL